MRAEFEVEVLGTLLYFLGMEVARIKQGISFLKEYTLDLLKEIGKLGCKPSGTSLELNWKWKVDKETPVEKGRYQKLVRKLIYLPLTRSNIVSLQVFSINLLTHQFNNTWLPLVISSST